MSKWVAWVLIGGAVGCAGGTVSRAPLSSNGSPARAPALGATVAAPAPAISASSTAAVRPAAQAAPNTRQALYDKACQLGSARACNQLGVIVADSGERAIPLFERSCELGYIRGCDNLGYLLLRDATQHERAVGLLDAACAKSDGSACWHLGDALYNDPKQATRAEASYAKACSLEQDEACISQGWMLFRGEGVSRNSKRAREAFQLACTHRLASGCSALGYAIVDEAEDAAELEDGLRYLSTGCEHDDGFGCYLLAEQRVAKEGSLTTEASELFAKACRLGLKRACKDD